MRSPAPNPAGDTRTIPARPKAHGNQSASSTARAISNLGQPQSHFPAPQRRPV